jgi:hypothetical protein
VRQSEVSLVLHVNYEEQVPVVRLIHARTREEMDLVSQTVKSFFPLSLKNTYFCFCFHEFRHSSLMQILLLAGPMYMDICSLTNKSFLVCVFYSHAC